MLTQDQIDFYRENGYLGVEGVLTPAQVEELGRVTDEFVEKSRGIKDSDSVFDLEPGHTAAEPRLRRLKSPSAQHPVYDHTLRHPKVLDIVEQLIGPDIRYNGHKLNMKQPEFGSPVEWHQDWAFYPHTNDDLLAVGVCLDDMTEENGCLLVMPGSHKGRVLDHHQDGHFIGAVTEDDFDDSAAAQVVLKAGGISIHHVRALHASRPNNSGKARRLLLAQYCAADAWPVQGSTWEAYTDTFLRGQPTNEPRVTEVPIRIPLPPPHRTGSIYESQTLLKNPKLKDAPAKAG